MSINLNRYGKLSLEARKKARAQRAQGIMPRHEQYIMTKEDGRKQEIENFKKVKYSTEVVTECDIYDIAYMDTVKTISYEPRLPGSTVVWPGGTYYTLGNKIESFDGETLDSCLVIIKESSHNYEYIMGVKYHRGIQPFNSKWNIYLYKNQTLYLMSNSSYQHPDVARNSYSFSDEACTNPLYINLFNKELERVLGQKENNNTQNEGPTLVKRKTSSKK